MVMYKRCKLSYVQLFTVNAVGASPKVHRVRPSVTTRVLPRHKAVDSAT